MKKILFSATLLFVLSSCKKDKGKGCWRGYDGLLVQTGVFCDKTKEEARSMPYTAFPGVRPLTGKYQFIMPAAAEFCMTESLIPGFIQK
jgi:hypothetical protein